MEFDFYGDYPHYIDHLAPLWLALPERHRGLFLVPNRMKEHTESLGVTATVMTGMSPAHTRRRTGPVVVAAWGSVLKWRRTRRKIVLLNHGAGQTYLTSHPSYSGGNHRGWVNAYLEPGPHAANALRAAGKREPIFEIGCMKLDSWHSAPVKPRGERPKVVFSAHWDCKVTPETGTSWWEFGDAMLALKDRFDVSAHAHPSFRPVIREAAEKVGIEFIENFDDVLKVADVYVSDNSSSLYEFASTGRPVVCVNASTYRRDVHHGLRFWNAVPGIQCDHPDDLADKIDQALAETPEMRSAREKAVMTAYVACDGKAAERGAQALIELARVWR